MWGFCRVGVGGFGVDDCVVYICWVDGWLVFVRDDICLVGRWCLGAWILDTWVLWISVFFGLEGRIV